VRVKGQWELDLYEGDGVTRRRIGTLLLREVRHDKATGLVELRITGDDRTPLGYVQVREIEAHGRAWVAALQALSKVYGPLEPALALKPDGMCNGITKTKHARCGMPAKPGAYYCQIHDPLHE
jgi:hypothetical protein